MEKRCFNCGAVLERIISCKDKCYICPRCDSIYFEQEIHIICPECECWFDNSYELITFEKYLCNKFIEVFEKCALCLLEEECI